VVSVRVVLGGHALADPPKEANRRSETVHDGRTSRNDVVLALSQENEMLRFDPEPLIKVVSGGIVGGGGGMGRLIMK
jgi:hypothetical protein